MGPLDEVRRMLEGDLGAFEAAGLPEDHAAESIAARTGLTDAELDLGAVTALLDEYLAQGQILRSLALLKICSVVDPAGAELIPHLQRVFGAGLDEDGQPDTIDPLAKEFLGTDRPNLAWSVLTRDKLQVARVPNEEGHFGGNGWMICHDERRRSSEAENGIAMVWWNTTPVAGKLRPAGRRRVSRRKLPLQVRLFFLSALDGSRQPRRCEAELSDLSATGVGVNVSNKYGRFDSADLNGEKIRLEIALPSGQAAPSTLARIVWAKNDTEDSEPVVRLGVQFLEPPEEFNEAVSELLVQGKGDQQYLWNLWESQTTRS